MSLLELLKQQHQFPSAYLHKIVGKNTQAFRAAIDELIHETQGLVRTGERLSANGAHVSITFELSAGSAEEVVFLIERSQKLADVLFVL